MSEIGSFGDLFVFEVSDDKILNPRDLKKTVSARWTEHARFKKRPLMEFVGPNNEEVTFTVILDARHGVKPRSTLSKIQKVVKKGKVSNFIIGGKRLGNTMYVVKQVSEFWDEIWNKGEIVRAKVDLTLEEYPEK